MYEKYSDIIIINKDKEYKLHKVILIYVPYFEKIFEGIFKESEDKIIYTDFDIENWELLLKNLYERNNLLREDNFSNEYLEFLKFLSLTREIDKFHNALKVKLDTYAMEYSRSSDSCIRLDGEDFDQNMSILEYILADPKLERMIGWSESTIRCFSNYYNGDYLSKEFPKNYPIVYYFLIISSLTDNYHKLKLKYDQQLLDKIYNDYFKDRIMIYIKDKEHLSYVSNILILVKDFSEFSQNDIDIIFTSNCHYNGLLYVNIYNYDKSLCNLDNFMQCHNTIYDKDLRKEIFTILLTKGYNIDDIYDKDKRYYIDLLNRYNLRDLDKKVIDGESESESD